MTVTTPSIETLREIVVGDGEEYEALAFEGDAVATTTGEIEYGITFVLDVQTTVVAVRRVRDNRLWDLAFACMLIPGDQLRVTYDMFAGGRDG